MSDYGANKIKDRTKEIFKSPCPGPNMVAHSCQRVALQTCKRKETSHLAPELLGRRTNRARHTPCKSCVKSGRSVTAYTVQFYRLCAVSTQCVRC